jgi:hypothetical protein
MANTGRPKSLRGAKPVTLALSPEAWELLRIRALNLGMTRSELVEKIARGEVPVSWNSAMDSGWLGKSFLN